MGPPASHRRHLADDDPGLQRREWRFERAETALLACLVAAALGLFGNGPLSRDSRRDGALEVRYQRFARSGSPVTLAVTVGPGASAFGSVDVLVSADYLSAVEVQGVSPEPDTVSVASGFQVFRIPVEPDAELQVSFSLQGEDIGALDGAARVGSGTVSFSQLVYP